MIHQNRISVLIILRKNGDPVNSCIKSSFLYKNGTIQPRYLTINERVRQFGGHPSYAKFLMFMGLGLLSRQRKSLFFSCKDEDCMINIPKKIGDVEIVKKYDSN